MKYEKLCPKGHKVKRYETRKQKLRAKRDKAKSMRLAAKKISFLAKNGEDYEYIVTDPKEGFAV